MESMRLRVPRKAADWIVNAWIVVAISTAIAAVVLVTYCAIAAEGMSRELVEFRAVIEWIGLP